MSVDNTMEVYFRNARRVIVPVSENAPGSVDRTTVATFLRNAAAYGFMFDGDAVHTMLDTLNEADFVTFALAYTDMLRTAVGAHVSHAPMYPNFPQQVMAADEAELYLNAVLHYLGDVVGLRILPLYESEPRSEIDTAEFKPLNIISLGDDTGLRHVFVTLVTSKLGLGASQITDLNWLIKTYGEPLLADLPPTLTNRENLAHLAAAVYTLLPAHMPAIFARATTVTDLLRIAASISGASAALTDGVRFANLPKATRRALLARMEAFAEADTITFAEDMSRHAALWKTLGEKLHPGDYTRRYPRTHDVFTMLRNNIPIPTHRGAVETAIKAHDVTTAVDLLAQRPGELARRLDQLLRLGGQELDVIETFRKVAPRVASTVLWQVRTHFAHRGEDDTLSMRTFFPKGNVAKVYGVENNLTALSQTYTRAIVRACDEALTAIYGVLPELGKVYVDPALATYLVPSAIRSASRALNVTGRGTRVPLDPAKDTARFFIWWHDGDRRTDLDLSAVLLDEHYRVTGELTYYNLRELGAVHSGDITSAPDGASEYIDISMSKMRERGVAYVMMVVNSYTGQSFVELPECFAGVMGRAKAQSGEIYEPRTVEHIFDLTADTRIAVPLLIDVNANEFIWADLALKRNPSRVNNVAANRDRLAMMTEAVVNMRRPSLYELFATHAAARGELVTTAEDADVRFELHDGHPSVPMTEVLAAYL